MQSEPAAVERARALRHYISVMGADTREFYVAITSDEGFELLRWFRSHPEVSMDKMNLSLLDRDIKKASKRGNPFDVLENFTVCGLTIKPREKSN